MNFNHFTYWNKQRVVTVEVLWMSFLPRVFSLIFLVLPTRNMGWLQHHLMSSDQDPFL